MYHCITTVYRSYRAHSVVVVVRVVVRIEQVIPVEVRTVHIAQAEISISRIAISIARSKPNTTHKKTLHRLTTMPLYPYIIDFFHPTKYLTISSIDVPNLRYLLLLIICFS